MKKIGITGGIGSGKSIICLAFQLFNIPIYNADNRAKLLINSDLDVREAIVNLLGQEAYDENGQYNKTWVAAQVFANPDLLQLLNEIVHPAVRRDAEQWFDENKDEKYVLYEAAIMNAAKADDKLDAVILVATPKPVRMQRILKRDPFRSKSDVEKIFENQKSDEEFAIIADFVIKNGEEDLVLEQVIRLHEQFSITL